MNEEHLKDGLNKIAAKNISDEQDVWPSVRDGLSQAQERSAPTPMIPRWGMAVAVVVTIGLIAGLVPSVRARLVDLAETIGGVNFTFSAEYPGSGGDVNIVPCEQFPLEELGDILAFTIPSSTPDGYILEDEAKVCYFSSTDSEVGDPHIELTWTGPPKEASIHLAVHASGWLVGETEVETLVVDGHEFAHWFGAWNYDTKEWDETIGQSFSWTSGELTYTLDTLAPMSVDVLVEMAASTFE